MKITKFKKEANIENDTARILIEVEVARHPKYEGFDVFPDKLIPDLLLAASRRYRIKKGELKESSLL